MLLADKVAVITGSANGIGEQVARFFADQGARLYLIDCDGEKNETLAESIRAAGQFATAITGDVRDRQVFETASEMAVREFDRLDILINNAGIYPRQRFLVMTSAQWDEMQDINLKSMFHSSQAVLPRMMRQGSGKIVNISSVTFHLGVENLAHYIASKGGVIGLTRALAREIGPQGIHVNCITPGAVLVEAEKAVATEEQVRIMVDHQSIKRRILPIDIARVCCFLSCDLSDGMTGQTLNVDGGWVMY
ncbi:MAG: glucose 1-dehydrogenase [Bryobacteraceae bacterium]